MEFKILTIYLSLQLDTIYLSLCSYSKLLVREGLYFYFHVDGAYGGYFAAITKQKIPKDYSSYSPYVQKQLENLRNTDNIIFDSHKTGYVPYICGCIIY